MKQKVKAGVDKKGRPYVDLTDPYTASKLINQAKRFRNIKLGE